VPNAKNSIRDKVQKGELDGCQQMQAQGSSPAKGAGAPMMPAENQKVCRGYKIRRQGRYNGSDRDGRRGSGAPSGPGKIGHSADKT